MTPEVVSRMTVFNIPNEHYLNVPHRFSRHFYSAFAPFFLYMPNENTNSVQVRISRAHDKRSPR